MSILVALSLFTYPFGLFGLGPASGSDAGMMLEQGIFALEYNPAGLAWIDSIEGGISAESLFVYNLVGVAYKYKNWPIAASVHHTPQTTGFSLGSGYLNRPLALGGAFGASFGRNEQQNLSLRFGLQWREYIGLALGPRLWLAQDTAHLSGMVQIGASVPIIEGLKFLAGASAQILPASFRASGGLAYEPFSFLRVQSVVATDGWGACIILSSGDDRGGIWVQKDFDEGTAWNLGLSYVRSVRLGRVKEVVHYRNLPARVDTVYILQTKPVNIDSTKVVSPDVRRKQEQLMAKANRLYAEERYEEALVVWKEVVQLDPSSDLAARANEDIKDVSSLIETLNRIRSGKPQ